MHIRGAKYSDYNEIQALIKRNGLKQRSENDWKNLWFKNEFTHLYEIGFLELINKISYNVRLDFALIQNLFR